MSRGFGATLGSASTDYVESAITAHSTLRSYAIWTYRNGDGGSSNGRMFNKGDSSGTTVEQLFSSAGTSTYSYQRNWNGVLVGWRFTRPAASEWHHIGYSYDSSSTSNNAVGYLDGVSQSITETSGPPVAPLNDNSDPYTIGNRRSPNNTVGWDGMLAWFAIWNVILTVDEFLALGVGVCPLVIRPMSLIEFLPLAGSTTHSWVAGATTVTGTAVQPDAFPHHYPARRRKVFLPAASIPSTSFVRLVAGQMRW